MEWLKRCSWKQINRELEYREGTINRILTHNALIFMNVDTNVKPTTDHHTA